MVAAKAQDIIAPEFNIGLWGLVLESRQISLKFRPLGSCPMNKAWVATYFLVARTLTAYPIFVTVCQAKFFNWTVARFSVQDILIQVGHQTMCKHFLMPNLIRTCGMHTWDPTSHECECARKVTTHYLPMNRCTTSGPNSSRQIPKSIKQNTFSYCNSIKTTINKKTRQITTVVISDLKRAFSKNTVIWRGNGKGNGKGNGNENREGKPEGRLTFLTISERFATWLHCKWHVDFTHGKSLSIHSTNRNCPYIRRISC